MERSGVYQHILNNHTYHAHIVTEDTLSLALAQLLADDLLKDPPGRSVSAKMKIVQTQIFSCHTKLSGLWHIPQVDDQNCPDCATDIPKSPKKIVDYQTSCNTATAV